MKNYKLTETKIGTAKVVVDIVPKGYCIPNTKITPTSITIHMTGNVGASAKNNHNYMKNINKNGSRIASWHFTVDDKEIYQAQSTNYKCYHAGCTSGNNTSIGIEIAMFNDKARQVQAYKNAIELVKILMAYHKFDTSKVKRHYDWTKKHCPAWLQEGKWGYTWSWFKGQLTTTTKKEEIKEGNKEVNVPFLATIICDELNIRKEANFNSEIVGVIKKGGVYTITEVKNGLGKLKSGQGWISIGEKYITKKEIVEEFKSYLARCKVNNLNCRKGAGTSYAVECQLNKGDVITIVGVQQVGSVKWGKAKSGYWVSLEYMEFVRYV